MSADDMVNKREDVTENEREPMQREQDNAPGSKTIAYETTGVYQTQTGIVYVSGCMAFRENTSFSVEIRGKAAEYKWKPCNTEVSIDAIRTICETAGGVGGILFASVLVALMKPLFVFLGYSVNFSVNLYGESESGKTKLVKALTGFLAERNQTQLNFTAHTKREIMEKFQSGFGFPLLLDDFHPHLSANERGRQEALLDLIIRTSDDNPRTAFVFVTSEMLGGALSTQNRMLQIHLEKLGSEEIAAFETACMSIPTVYHRFLQQLVENFEEVQGFIVDQLSDCRNMVDRLDWSQRHMVLAARLFGKYCLKDEAAVETKIAEALKQQGQRQRQHLRMLDYTGKCVKPLKLVLEMLQSKSLFQPVNYMPTMPNEIMTDSRGNVIFKKVSLQYGIEKMGMAALLKPIDIIRALSDDGILCEDRDSYTTKVGGARVYRLNLIKLRQIVQFYDKS